MSTPATDALQKDVDSPSKSWDVCMSWSYCKIPVIIGIVVGSLVVLTLIYCLVRCTSLGERCFGLRGRRTVSKKASGYKGFQPGPPPPVPYDGHTQYDPPKEQMYTQSQPSPYSGPHSATFDAPSKFPIASTRYNEDQLPPMPSWNDAKKKHIEEEPLEMERLHTAPESQHELQPHILSGYDDTSDGHFSGTNYLQSSYAPSATQHSRSGSQQGSHYGTAEQDPHAYTTNAYMPSAPYENYYDQYTAHYPPQSPPPPRSSHSTTSTTQPMLRRTASQSTAGPGSVLPLYSQPIHSSGASEYAPSSTMPPSYQTRAPSATRSPPPMSAADYAAVGAAARSTSAHRSPPPQQMNSYTSPRSPSATRSPVTRPSMEYGAARSPSATRSPIMPQPLDYNTARPPTATRSPMIQQPMTVSSARSSSATRSPSMQKTSLDFGTLRSPSATRSPALAQQLDFTPAPAPARAASATRSPIYPTSDYAAARSPSANRGPPLSSMEIGRARGSSANRGPPLSPMGEIGRARASSLTRSAPPQPPTEYGIARRPSLESRVSPPQLPPDLGFARRPSLETRVSPPQPPSEYGAYVPPRRPVQGSWRDV